MELCRCQKHWPCTWISGFLQVAKKSDPEVLVFLDLADGVLIILFIKVNFQSGILNPEEAYMVERIKLS
jgi:hypothetical protein